MLHAAGLPAGQYSAPPSLATDEANTDSFFVNLTDPQLGQRVPFQSLDRTRTSLSASQF